MEENPADPSRAATKLTTESPLLPSQPFHNGTQNDFQSSSLPHLGDFITKLIEDAYKLQSANAELERTKQLLREAEDKLASSEESKSHLSTEIDRTKQQLRRAENALKREQKMTERLEADNASLKANLRHYQDFLNGTDESLCIRAKNKLRAVESRTTILEAVIRKKNEALEQKDEEMQFRIHSYRDYLRKIEGQFRKTWSIIRLLAASNFCGVKDGLISVSLVRSRVQFKSGTPQLKPLIFLCSHRTTFLRQAVGIPLARPFLLQPSHKLTRVSFTVRDRMQLKPLGDTNAHVAGTSSEQQTVQKSAEANAPKMDNTMLAAENEKLKAELEGVKQELRTAQIKAEMEEKAREQEAGKQQKANESLEAAQGKIFSVNEANNDMVLAFHTTGHQLHRATEEAISAQRERDALQKELEGIKFVRDAFKSALRAKERELCNSRAAMSLQGECLETTKERLLAVENMLHNSRKTSTTVTSELEFTKQILKGANDEICARASAQAALQTELEDTKHKLHLAVKERASSETERTLLDSSLAMTKLHLSRVDALLAACVSENNVLKGFLSGHPATIETAVSQIFDKLAALDHSIAGRLSAFENSVTSTMGELYSGVQSSVELVEGLKLQLSEAKLPAEVVEEIKRLTQAGSVAEDPDDADPETSGEVNEIFGDYLTHVVENMVKEEKAVQEAIRKARERIIKHQDWLYRFRKVIGQDESFFDELTHHRLRFKCWKRCESLIKILFDVEEQYDDVIDHLDTILEECDEMVEAREAVLEL
ncbi:hypothetical protein GE21DRAFT_1310333 [Neurospora crassa]|nr:hypothetical protein GE21DRAFT_1310333 [Neurospora crassa]